MRVAQVGNFDPPHSTENELRKALDANGCEVYTHQEGNVDAWRELVDTVSERDFVVWTRTASELGKIPVALQDEMVQAAHRADVPVVGYHLDIWFGLKRAKEIRSIPYFRMVDFMCSADGGHDEEFKAHGVNHVWFPPGVSEFECGHGSIRGEFKNELGFVGNWDGSYHREWRHRFDLVDHLKKMNCKFWPEPGKHAVRGPDLRDLYASVDVVVGDSCLVSPKNYWSDRIPETLGRGGVLIHPYIQGLEDHFELGKEIEVWNPGDWGELDRIIFELKNDPERRKAQSDAGIERVLKDHTYTVRMRQLIDMLKRENRVA